MYMYMNVHVYVPAEVNMSIGGVCLSVYMNAYVHVCINIDISAEVNDI
jgi:hypothetical protein